MSMDARPMASQELSVVRSVRRTGGTRPPPAAPADGVRRARPAPALPSNLRQWTAPTHFRKPPVRTADDYQPTLDASFIDAHWQLAFHAAGRGGGMSASTVGLEAPVYHAAAGRGPPASTVGLDTLAADATKPQVCTPTAIIARHLQSTLRAGFAKQQGVLFDRGELARSAQARLQAQHPVRWRAAPVRVPPRFVRT